MRKTDKVCYCDSHVSTMENVFVTATYGAIWAAHITIISVPVVVSWSIIAWFL